MAELQDLLDIVIAASQNLPDDKDRLKALKLMPSLAKAAVAEPQSTILGAKGDNTIAAARAKGEESRLTKQLEFSQKIDLRSRDAQLKEAIRQQERTMADMKANKEASKSLVDNAIKGIQTSATTPAQAMRILNSEAAAFLSPQERQQAMLDLRQNMQAKSAADAAARQQKVMDLRTAREGKMRTLRIDKIREAGLKPSSPMGVLGGEPVEALVGGSRKVFMGGIETAKKAAGTRRGLAGAAIAAIVGAMGLKALGGNKQEPDPAVQQAMLQMMQQQGGGGGEEGGGDASMAVGRQILNLSRVANLIKTIQQMNTVSQMSAPAGVV
ncbi:MAG: hypothetical protein ACKV2Q_36435 [Planctomycetaceae bacterium]